jgi:hypothetical protein
LAFFFVPFSGLCLALQQLPAPGTSASPRARRGARAARRTVLPPTVAVLVSAATPSGSPRCPGATSPHWIPPLSFLHGIDCTAFPRDQLCTPGHETTEAGAVLPALPWLALFWPSRRSPLVAVTGSSPALSGCSSRRPIHRRSGQRCQHRARCSPTRSPLAGSGSSRWNVPAASSTCARPVARWRLSFCPGCGSSLVMVSVVPRLAHRILPPDLAFGLLSTRRSGGLYLITPREGRGLARCGASSSEGAWPPRCTASSWPYAALLTLIDNLFPAAPGNLYRRALFLFIAVGLPITVAAAIRSYLRSSRDPGSANS